MCSATRKAYPGVSLPQALGCLLLLLLTTANVAAEENQPLRLGPIWQEFALTLEPGDRTEVAGPLFYREHRATSHTFAVPPLFSYTRDPDLDVVEYDLLYPLLTYDRYGEQYRWQFFQLLSWAGGPTQVEPERKRFTLYPIYFQQRSSDTNENYTALIPFYGHLQRRLMRNEIFFVMFPLYSKTRKGEVVTRNYLYPILHQREGPGLKGWQVWPLLGHEHKDVTWRTNQFEDLEMVPGHDKRFFIWPIYHNQVLGLGTTNLSRQYGALPLFSIFRSPGRDSTTVLWPFFSRVDDRQKKYTEWDLPWPLVVFANGEGKTTRRVFPFYSHAYTTNLQSDFVLWPIYKYNRVHSGSADRRRTRILFFLFSDVDERNLETKKSRRRVDMWPLFTRRRDLNGNTRLQIIAPLEPILTGSHSIERNYSPVWSLWRDERNPSTGASSQSFLWNLYRRDRTPDQKQVSALFGLYQSSSSPEGNRKKIFFIPFGKSKTKAPAPSR